MFLATKISKPTPDQKYPVVKHLCVMYIFFFVMIEIRDNILFVTNNVLFILFCFPGLWSSPSNSGSRHPPCPGFSLTMTDEDQAVMFGGFNPSGQSSEAHVLHLPTMVSHLC